MFFLVDQQIKQNHHLIAFENKLLHNHHILPIDLLNVQDHLREQQEEGFSRNSGHSDESGTSDIQGIPYGNAHQLAMVPGYQGIASAGA